MAQTSRQTDKQTDGHGNSMTESAQTTATIAKSLYFQKSHKSPHHVQDHQMYAHVLEVLVAYFRNLAQTTFLFTSAGN